MIMKKLIIIVLYLYLTNGKNVFFNDTSWTTDKYLTTSQKLGSFPYQCLGNIKLCPNGLTLTAWLKPELPLSNHDNVVLVTLGGDSSVSEGYYVKRKHAEEFESGVLKGMEVWRAKFYLVSSSSWTQVGLTWSQTNGLAVYIDGLMVSQTLQPSKRNFLPLEYSSFPDITVGSTLLKYAFRNIAILDKEMSKEQVYSDLDSNSGQLVIQCFSSKPSLKTYLYTTSASNIQFSLCQKYCSKHSYNGFILRTLVSCECVDLSSITNFLSTGHKCQSNQDTLSWSTHSFINFKPLLKASVQILPSKTVFNLTENVVFMISVESNDSPIRFIADFNDGNLFETDDKEIGHAWTKEGSYKVNITAVGYFASHSVVSAVEVKMISSGKSPYPVLFQTWTSQSTSDIGKVSYQLSAFSSEEQTCVLNFDKDNTLNYDEKTKLVLKERNTYVYDPIGFHNTSLVCSNQFGSQTSKQILTARKPKLLTKHMRYSDQDSVAIKISNVQNNGRVFIDSKIISSNSYLTSVDSLTVGMKTFKNRGLHSLVVKSKEDKPVVNEIVGIIKAIKKISISAPTFNSKINETILFTITISQGDQIYLELLCGNGKTSFHFVNFVSSPVSLKTECSYASLGKYLFSVVAVNEISDLKVGKKVSIERDVASASLSLSNTVQLGTYSQFEFTVDANKVPAVPLSFNVDYGNGVVDDVELKPVNEATPIYKHHYVYPQFGIYIVNSRVYNNLSSLINEPAVIQIGQNLTAVDLYVEESNVLAGTNITLNVKCPTGSPVELELDLGDGNKVKYFRPTNYKVEDNYDGLKTSVKSEKSAINRNPNYLDDFVIKYAYKSKGMYKVQVKATNMFSSTKTSLCPKINVVNPSNNNLQCNSISVSVNNASTFGAPIVANRSSFINFKASSQLQCSQNHATPLYVWEAEKLVNSLWKPELQICESGSSRNIFTIPANTLWYGTYRLNVSVVVSQTAVPTTAHSSMVPVFLKIVPTSLVAVITSDKENFYSNFDLIRLNLSKSSDPDVTTGNITGLSYVVVCSYADAYNQLTLDEVKQKGTLLTKNALVDGYMYQFNSKPCFKPTSSIDFNKDLTVGFLANEILTSEQIKFSLFLSKDERMSFSSVKFSVLMTNLSASPLDSIDALLSNGDTGAALQILDLVTNSLESNGAESGDAQGERTKTRGKIINCLNKVSDNLHDADQLIKTTKVMSDVTSNPKEVTSNAKGDAAKGLNNAAGKASELTKGSSKDQVQDITLSVLATAGSILPFAPTNVTDNSTQTDASKRAKRSLMDDDDVESDNETESLTCCERLNGLCAWIEEVPEAKANETSKIDLIDLKLTNWTDAECDLVYPCDMAPIKVRYQQYLDAIDTADKALKESTTTNGMGAVGTVGGLLMGRQTSGESVNMAIPGMNMTVANLASDSSSSPNGFDIPKSAGGCGAMALDSGNPFTYGSEPSDVSGGVKTLVLTNCDGSPLKIQNSSQPFMIWMEGSPDEPVFNDFKLVHLATKASFNYHVINLKFNSTAIFASLKADRAETYNVYIKYEGFPNATYNDWQTTIPDQADANYTNSYTVFFPQDVTKLNGTYRIGVSLNSSEGTEVGEEDKNVTYALTSFTSSCKYWNESSKSWATDGCSVGPLTSFKQTQCLCTHLTSFGGSFAVPPNTIDFSTVFSMENFLESLPVFGTVIAMIVIYVLVLVWARHKDKKDIARWGAVPLEDNLPTETYYYQIVVSTGMRKNSGTKSKPSFILSGDEADTGVRLMTDGKRKEIQTGSINNYILSVDKCLGPLTFLRIWHDNSGISTKKGWFLDQVEVLDIQTAERFFFVCSQWMAVEEGDGQIERVIPVAGKDDMTQFGQLFSHSIRKKFSNDHLWFSVFSRPTRSSFTRVQRVSCCFSLLFMTMIVNCMFFKSTNPDHTTSVHIGPITITLQQLYISVVSSLIILPPSVAIITIFKKSRPKQNTVQLNNAAKSGTGWKSIEKESEMWSENDLTRKQKLKDAVDNITQFYKKPKNDEDEDDDLEMQQKTKKKKKSSYLFPWWTLYIGWALVFFTIVAPGFFTILYSMQWGREKSMDWLQTFFLSFFQSVIVVQPIKVLILTAFISCILKKPDIEEEGGDDVNILQNDELSVAGTPKKSVRAIMKQRQKAMSTAGVLDSSRLKELRVKRLKEIQIEAILKECIIYIFFIFVLYFISYQDKDNRSFTFVQNLQNQYFGSGSLKFAKISTYDDVYTWINHTLMGQLYTEGWYNGEGPKTWQESLQTNDRVTIRLGVARIRQLRIKEESCKIEKDFRKLIKHCRDDYNWMDDEVKSYTKGWDKNLTKKEAKAAKKKDEDKHNPWLYRNSIELKSAPYMGKINTYKGGGYVFNFYCNPEKTLKKLQELKDNNWLDVQTRAVIVEFTVYNANANLFGSVIMLQEFLSTGVPVTSQEVKVFRISSYVGPFGIIVILFQFIFVCFVIYFLVHTVNMIRKQKRKYFCSFWNILELLTVFMSIVTIAMYGMKMIFGSSAMKILKETGMGDYVNFVTIGLWAETYGIMLAIVVFLATIKFINMLKFNRRLSMLTETIRYSIKDMKAFVVTFFLYLFAFIQLGYLLFSMKLVTFRNISAVTETLLQFFIGEFNYLDYTIAQPVLGPIYFFMFVWAIIFGMQTMFLVIIIEAFQAVRKENQFKKNDYEVGEYLMTRIKGMFGRE